MYPVTVYIQSQSASAQCWRLIVRSLVCYLGAAIITRMAVIQCVLILKKA